MTRSYYKKRVADLKISNEYFIEQPFIKLLEHVAMRFFLYGIVEPHIEDVTRKALIEFYTTGSIIYTFEEV